MKSKIINIFWAIVLIIVSGLLVAEAVGHVNFASVTGRDWAIAFGIASAAFILTYFLDGVKQWGWLFPALICATFGWSSFHTGRAFDFLNQDWPMLAALAIPFYVGFAVNRKRWGLLVPAYLLTVPALIIFSGEMAADFYLTAGIYRTIKLVLASGVVEMLLFALPFFVIYFWSKKNWWALMPAGGLVSVGLINVLSILIPNGQNTLPGVYNATLLLGFAATMGVLWLRRSTHPTDWAKYPAAGFLVLAIAAFIMDKGWVSLSQDNMAVLFAAGCAAFLLAYFLHGVRNWGWLFPAFACAALALTIWMENRGMVGAIMGMPIFASAALAFYAGFAVDRKRRGLLIPATLLTGFSTFFLIVDTVQEDWSGVIFLFMLALPFLITYFMSKRNWWALIPAGGLASLGLVTLLETLIPHQNYPNIPNHMSLGIYTWVLFLSLAATFGLLWLRHKTQPTDWAKYPAIGLLALSVLAILLGEHLQEVLLAAVTFVVGAMLLLATLNKKKPVADQQTLAGKA